ncbi:hypothetical protein BC829DRAFT_423411 [Chytridium lagenaria]|nr:hypothetical protein BC829DRAFT_423411 [Chytridium lagenaria]
MYTSDEETPGTVPMSTHPEPHHQTASLRANKAIRKELECEVFGHFVNLKTLKPNSLIDDSVINAYGKLLAEERNNLEFWETFQLSALIEDPALYKREELKKILMLHPTTLSTHIRLSLMPIHWKASNHWTCVAVLHNFRICWHYDPLEKNRANERHDRVENTLSSMEGWTADEWVYKTIKSNYMQLNHYDCGVYTCLFMEYISRLYLCEANDYGEAVNFHPLYSFLEERN